MDEELITKLAETYSSGVSAERVARQYGVSAWKVYDSCQRRGIPRRAARIPPREFTDAEQKMILAMWDEGQSAGAIAESLETYILKIQRFLGENGRTFRPRPSSRRGDKSHSWRGGRIRNNKGYVLIRLPREHPLRCMALASGYVQEHRLVMAEQLGRPLFEGENVHHKNGVKDDNRPENLELWVTSQPEGQRPEDLVEWAREILRRYAP